MALTVEDGSIVAGAESYVSAADARTYATKRGLSLPVDDAAAEALLLQAMDYLEARRERYQGTKVSTLQSLQWPRYPVVIDGVDVASTAIPKELVTAQILLAVEAQTTPLMPTGSGRELISQSVPGAISQTWAQTGAGAAQPEFVKVEAYLAPLYTSSGLNIAVSRG